jgi:hypothetical protein
MNATFSREAWIPIIEEGRAKSEERSLGFESRSRMTMIALRKIRELSACWSKN